MKPLKAIILLLSAIALFGCEPGELRPVAAPVGGAIGGSGTVPQNPSSISTGKEVLTPATPLKTTWNEPAGAKTKKEAITECLRRAEERSKERGKTVAMINVIPAVKGWLCVFEE